jgi:C1A family cysteine protease
MTKKRASATARRSKPSVRAHQWYGWIPDLPDQRDQRYAAPLATLGDLPAHVDLSPHCPPVYDQGQLGSCTANAIAGAIEFDQIKQSLDDVFAPSRLFIYYNERVIENTVDEDAGAMIRDGIKSVSKQGAPHETLWPYAIAKFRTKPSAPSYKDAAKHPAVLYQRVTQQHMQLKGCLASGYPFIFGFTVYEGFESAQVGKTGHLGMPKPTERMIGGHAVLCVGYDDGHDWFIVRNSWGASWGMKGYFTMPYAYIEDRNLADDLWTIRLVQ